MGLGEKLSENIEYVVVAIGSILVIGGAVMGGMYLNGNFASVRKIEPIYSFTYKRKPGAVMYKDMKFGIDEYFIKHNGLKMQDGEIITDDNKIVSIGVSGGFQVRDYKENKAQNK